MPVSGLGDAEPVLIAATGIFSRRKSEKSCVMTSIREAAEIPGFCDHGKCRLRFDTEKTGQLVDIFPVFLLRRKFLDSLLDPSKLCRQIVVGQQIFFQNLLMQFLNTQCAEPAEMCLRPVVLGPVIVTPMPQAEGKNLLLDLFQGKTVVIPHPNEFLDLLILLCGNMHRTVIMVCKASGDHGCVALICFDPLFPARHRHTCRCKDHALHIVCR